MTPLVTPTLSAPASSPTGRFSLVASATRLSLSLPVEILGQLWIVAGVNFLSHTAALSALIAHNILPTQASNAGLG